MPPATPQGAALSRDEFAAWLRLTLSPGLGPGAVRRLLAAFGLPEQVLAQPAAALRQLLGPAQVQALQDEPPGLAEGLARSWDWLQAGADGEGGVGRRVLTLADADYPASLLAIEDPPPLLYLMGRTRRLEALRGIAIVGSRNPTPQGRANAREFGRALAGAGLTVVSGLALGIDGAAHEGALEGAAPDRLATVAVVGTGLDRVYPRQHLQLARRIARQGLLLSEYPLGTPPLAPNFPRRNRLIAGLSQGTLVVEAALRSGSLITARLAAEQGREVFAIPGSIHAAQSRGCHALIRQGAKLVESAQDVLEELCWPVAAAAAAPTAVAAGSDDPLLALMGHDPVGLDALQARSGLDTPTLQARLLTLELDGAVGRLPGGLFQRLAHT